MMAQMSARQFAEWQAFLILEREATETMRRDSEKDAKWQ